jgi:hypothetical protein
MSSLISNQNTPIMTKETFSSLVGVSVSVIDKYIRNNYLPTIKLKRDAHSSKRTYINVAALNQVCIEDASEFIANFGGLKNADK